MVDNTYKKEFKYTHDNPYHDKLEAFSHFVLRDHEAEEVQGKWNKLVFERPDAPLHVEIGSGYGHFMLEFCEKNPKVNFVGIDYRFKRSFQLAKKLAIHPTKNFRYLRGKGERLEFMFGEKEIDSLYYFFPDPWPKTRHHKKRLFQERFLQSVHKVLKKDGIMYIKTDHDEYAKQMKKLLNGNSLFNIIMQSDDLHIEYPDHFLSNYITKFEKIFLKQDIKIKAFVIEKKEC